MAKLNEIGWIKLDWTVVLLYGESRRFELIFLQYGASALMQTDNFSVGAIMQIVKKSWEPFCKFLKKGESRFANSQKKLGAVLQIPQKS